MGAPDGFRRRTRHPGCRAREDLRPLLSLGPRPHRARRRAGSFHRSVDRQAASRPHPRRRRARRRSRDIRGLAGARKRRQGRDLLIAHVLLSFDREAGGMFDIAPDHAIGLYAGLLALPVALVAIRLRPARRRVPGTVLGASVLLAMSGAVHLALLSTHVSEPLTSWLFLANGTGYLALSFAFTWRWWRVASASMLIATLLGYVVWIAIGLDSPDQVALATKLLELTALGLVLVPVRGEHMAHRSWRWASLAIALPLLTLVATSAIWIVDLARPAPQHAHAGAVLQATNDVATPEQIAAAAHRPVRSGPGWPDHRVASARKHLHHTDRIGVQPHDAVRDLSDWRDRHQRLADAARVDRRQPPGRTVRGGHRPGGGEVN